MILNNWEIDDDVEEEKIDEFVYLKNDKYYVQKEIDGEIVIFGTFHKMDDAISFRNLCVKTNWKF